MPDQKEGIYFPIPAHIVDSSFFAVSGVQPDYKDDNGPHHQHVTVWIQQRNPDGTTPAGHPPRKLTALNQGQGPSWIAYDTNVPVTAEITDFVMTVKDHNNELRHSVSWLRIRKTAVQKSGHEFTGQVFSPATGSTVPSTFIAYGTAANAGTVSASLQSSDGGDPIPGISAYASGQNWIIQFNTIPDGSYTLTVQDNNGGLTGSPANIDVSSSAGSPPEQA